MRKAALALITLLPMALAAPVWARQPVVVELYTSQGCSACAKAGETLEGLDAKPPVLALTFGVDYWDYLGWTDTFAKPEFSARQRDYMGRLALRDVYTPQVVVDGQLEAAATASDKIEALVKQAAHKHGDPPQVQFRKGEVAVGSAPVPKGGGEVWLVRYDPHDQAVAVKAGDNRGLSLVEHNVVKELTLLGRWTGRPGLYRLPPPTADGLATAILVQGAHGGRILAVASPPDAPPHPGASK